MFEKILLCTHGTPGAERAEKLVFERFVDNGAGAHITVLTVINEDWKLMTGDDWLNSSRTRNDFRLHVARQVSAEIDEDWARLKKSYPPAAQAHFIKEVGPVEETIAETARSQGCDLIVIGPYQKKQGRGFKARIENKRFHHHLSCPLLVAP
ncbi:MAG: universal stress protein [bacterium]|nr:universal stress protein [bacterium]